MSECDNMIAYWQGEDNANDYKNNYNGTMVNGDYVDGQVERCFRFNSNGEYVSTSFVPSSLNSDNFSVELWFYPYSKTTTCIVGSTDGSSHRFYIFTHSGGGCFLGVESSHFFNTTVLPYNINAWNHIYMSYNRSTGQIASRINGGTVQYSSRTDAQLSTYDFRIGRHNGGGNEQFNGLIDEVVIYDYVLPESSALDHYNTGLAGEHYCEEVTYINLFNQSTATPGQIVTSTINKDVLVSRIQDAGTDDYFDSTSKIHSVHIKYIHNADRQRKTIIHSGDNLQGIAAWFAGARDGTWEKSEIITYDANEAKNKLFRTNIGTHEDATTVDGTAYLNT